MKAPMEGGLPEARLLDHVHQLQRNQFEWRAVYLHLSRLRPHNRRDYQLRVAAAEFEPLLQRHQGEAFVLTDGDLVVLCKGATVAEMDAAVLRLRYLFSDDPLLARAGDGDAEEGDDVRLCTWYDLETDYNALCFACEDLLADVERRRGRPTAGQALAPPPTPLDARLLARIEGDLAKVDVAGLLRRQPICAVVANHPPQAVFTEVHVAIDELARALAPGVDLIANRWLFQHLTAALDERVLAAVAADAGGGRGPVSLNLNVATLLAPAFSQFSNEVQGAVGRERFLIELQLLDVYADLGAYVFARDLARGRGCMVCLDGLHHLHLPLVDRARLGADFVKLLWSADLLDDAGGERREEMQAVIKRTGVERIILCRCGSADAVRWGQALGIRLFQGRYVDSRLRAQRSPSIAAARRAIRSAAG